VDPAHHGAENLRQGPFGAFLVPPDWLLVRNTLIIQHPIGHIQRIFSMEAYFSFLHILLTAEQKTFGKVFSVRPYICNTATA
jgi:hypothetical protein